MDAVIQALLQHGVLGIVVCLLVLWIWYKDKQEKTERDDNAKRVEEANAKLSAEQKARVDDAKAFTDTAMELQAKVIDACSALTEAVEQHKRLGDLVEKLLDTIQKYGLARAAAREDRGRYGS